MLQHKTDVLNIPQEEKKKRQLKLIYKGLFYDRGSLWILWNPLTGHLLLAKHHKAGDAVLLIGIQPRNIPTASEGPLITSESHASAQHPGLPLLLPLPSSPSLPWTDISDQLPGTNSLWDYVYGNALVILIKNPIRALVCVFCHKWIPEMSLGEEKEQRTSSQVNLTARIMVAINNRPFMSKLLQLPGGSLSPEKGTNLWAKPHDHVWFYVVFVSTCHQDNSLILNGGGKHILEKGLQEIPL